MNVDRLRTQLVDEEGLRLTPYRDSVGKLTIGVGRNLEDRGITRDEAIFLLDNDIIAVLDQLAAHVPFFAALDDVRQRVLADMAFNVGMGGLLGFKNTLAAVARGDYDAAAVGMLASRWATQVGDRALVLAEMMRSGKDPA